MHCEQAQETLSACLDGEATADEQTVLDLHLGSCPACTSLQVELLGMHRTMHIRPASLVPDLAPALLAQPRPYLGRSEWVRYLLGVVASTSLVLGLPILFSQEAGGHQDRHLGAFTVAMSIGLLFAAIKPHRAAGLLPMAAALGLTLTVGAAIDLTQGQETLLAESQHLLDLAGLALLWVLSGVRAWSLPKVGGYRVV